MAHFSGQVWLSWRQDEWKEASDMRATCIFLAKLSLKYRNYSKDPLPVTQKSGLTQIAGVTPRTSPMAAWGQGKGREGVWQTSRFPHHTWTGMEMSLPHHSTSTPPTCYEYTMEPTFPCPFADFWDFQMARSAGQWCCAGHFGSGPSCPQSPWSTCLCRTKGGSFWVCLRFNHITWLEMRSW